MHKQTVIKRERTNKIYWFLFAILGIGLDIVTKYWANSSLNYNESIELTPFLNWTLLYNEGAAFSFLAEHSGWQRWLFAVISFFASLFIIIWMLRTKAKEKFLLMGLSMVLAGAIGNLIDRLRLGKVIDFIHLHYNDYNWPVFNVADILVSVGVVIILLSSLLDKQAE